VVFTDEAQAEIGKMLKSANYYVTIDKQIAFSANTDTINYTLSSMTQ
jgi:uncharacterized lipoprotein YajG